MSLGGWMELPSLPMDDWRRITAIKEPLPDLKTRRTSAGTLARYYPDYVQLMGLDENFVENTVVTSVRQLHGEVEDEKMEMICEQEVPSAPPPPPHPLYEVAGYRITDEGRKPFKYRARNVVLATGQADTQNRLEVAGERLPFVLHSVPELEAVVASGKITSGSDPVLVVGAGLSGADAIISAQGHRLPVAHLFRKRANDPQLIFAKLPGNLYPEYHAVHAMMDGRSEAKINKSTNVDFEEGAKMYTAWAESEVIEILENQRVVIRGPQGTHTLNVSYVVVLIGSSPNLSFLSSQGDQLGRVRGHAIDRNNTIDISPFTHQSNNVPGLFALGPLTGDNFVRFIQGGALAIASHVHQTRRSTYSD